MAFINPRKYWVLGAKGFAQNLQYTASHLINTIASAVFGVIYVYLWKCVTPSSGFADYTPAVMMHYVILNQTTMWFTQFGIRVHIKIRDALGSGNVATELMRPMNFFAYRMTYEYGSMIYGLVFRGLPVGIMLSSFGFYIPRNPATWGWTLLALVWGIALMGILLKIFLFQKTQVVSTVLYIVMGLLIISATKPLLETVPVNMLLLIIAGGLFYLVGVFFFLAPKIRYHHTIWHLFVLGGSITHFLAILLYLA